MRIFYLLCALFLMPIGIETREQRRQLILEILGSRAVERQSELVELLRARGIEATQSSISRDLKQLGITKLADGYQPALTDATRDAEVPAEFIRNIDTAGPNITVIHTPIGAAQRVAVMLDRSDWPEIVGTVSGDDTIFVATRSRIDQKQFIVRLQSRFSLPAGD